MEKNQFKIGDIVRVTKGRHKGGVGTIVLKALNNYVVDMDIKERRVDSIHHDCLEPYPPRRTFEEICKELAENTAISAEFRPVEVWSNIDEPFIFLTDCGEEEGWEPIVIHRDGKAEINITLSAAQLAAVAAACTKIAANYAAEHGKEEA